MNKNLVMVTNNTTEDIKRNEYLKQQHKELDLSIKTVFGLLDAEANKTRTPNMRVAFLNSILYNILRRACLFEMNEEEFIDFMRKIYNSSKDAQEQFKNV